MKEADTKMHQEHMQLLKDAAAALKTAKPALAEELNKMAMHHHKMKKEVKKETAEKIAVAAK
jgi:hypothetical protein